MKLRVGPMVLGMLLLAGSTRATPAASAMLQAELDRIAASAQGRVGVAAAILGTGEIVARDGDGRYPMQSVYKLPIAMAVLHAVDEGELDLTHVVQVEPVEFVSDAQHSPLRDAHPQGASLPLAEILRLAVAESDGTASDVLLRLIGGPERVMGFLGGLGLEGIRVLDTEQAIGRDDAVQYLNWATPRASVALLAALHEGRSLSASSRDQLLRWMIETGTGQRRLKALLPEGTIVAHKTGTSRSNAAGVTAATNDIGLVTLPDGRALALAVYVCDSPADQATRERILAEIARAVWDAVTATPVAGGTWRRDDASLAWTIDDRVVWRFTFGAGAGKPHFHPLAPVGGECLTEHRPDDHPWHYGLWFSWKYINGANYWEEDRATGRSEGTTRWEPPLIRAGPDGSAEIRMELIYVHPSGRTDLWERRDIAISAPAADGSYTIDWRGDFTAGGDGALLDRTPLPGEPGGQPWGGYGGLGLRALSRPAGLEFLTAEGFVTEFVDDRARPVSAAVAANFSREGRDIGGIALLSDPTNATFAAGAPWYIVHSAGMNFLNSAVLAPRPIRLAAGTRFHLRYRIVVRGRAWTPDALRALVAVE